MNVHISIIHISQKWRQPKCSRRMNKQNVVSPCDELSDHKWNEVLTYATTWMSLQNIMLSEESSHKRPHNI